MTKIIDQKELYVQKNNKIGLLGGTFDPPHFAHTYMAEVAQKELGLDKVVFMPSGNPPHKKRKIVTDANNRLDMIEIAIEQYSNFYIDAYEVYSDNPSYTVDSIRRVNKLLSDSSKLYFIIGADSLLYLDKWYDAQHLLNITNFVVIPRIGYEKEQCYQKIEDLRTQLNANIRYIDCKPLEFASTSIRQSIAKRKFNDLSINKKVLKYIKDNKLYENV